MKTIEQACKEMREFVDAIMRDDEIFQRKWLEDRRAEAHMGTAGAYVRRFMSPENRAKSSERMKKQRQDPEFIRKLQAGRKKYLEKKK